MGDMIFERTEMGSNYPGHSKRLDGTYVPKGQLKTLVLDEGMGSPEMIICDGRCYYPALEGEPFSVVAHFVASLLEDAEYASEKIGQAQPVYYAIRDSHKTISAKGYADESTFVFDTGCGPDGEWQLEEAVMVFLGQDDDGIGEEWYDANELARHRECAREWAARHGKENIGNSIPSCRDFLNEYVCGEEVYLAEEWFICPNTMFLTHKDAEEHLKLNRHHYTSKAHVFCMTAWRSPAYEEFINALKTMFEGE